jgi:hypothetical protein
VFVRLSAPSRSDCAAPATVPPATCCSRWRTTRSPLPPVGRRPHRRRPRTTPCRRGRRWPCWPCSGP